MSSRQSRKQASSARKEAPAAATPSTSTPTSSKSPGRSRPPSPTVISRIQEKEQLAGLNDRLAVYIDRVRHLETENRQLTKQITTHEETVTREITNIKSLYEQELADARKLLDDLAREKAALQIDANGSKAALAELKDKHAKAVRDSQISDKKLLAAEAKVNDLQARLSDAMNQSNHWQNEYNKVAPQLNSAEKSLHVAKKQLEEETVTRVDLENRMQTVKEELSFKSQIHEQELNETRSRTEMHIEEVDGKLHQEYEGKLKSFLQQMRDENEQQILATREETETVFLEKLDDLKNKLNQREVTATSATEEVRNLRKQVDHLSSENTKLNNLVANYEQRIKNLENNLKREQDEHQVDVHNRDAEIARLRVTLEDQLQEYRDLLDVKLALDVEIAAYRKLLEAEELRLNISTSSEATPGLGTTPIRGMSRKRKRMGLSPEAYSGSSFSQFLQSSKAGFTQSSTAKGSIEVFETDEEGKYVKLYNTSEKNVPIGGWSLKHKAGEDETVFKFHRSVHIKPGEYVTIWSADCGETHAPPATIVMKSQKWVIADNMVTALVDNKGVEVASREMNRSLLRTTYSGVTDETDGGDPRRDDKCIVM